MKNARWRRRLSDLFRLIFFGAVCSTALFGHYFKGGPDPFADQASDTEGRSQESYFVGARYHLLQGSTPKLFLDAQELTLIGAAADRIFMTSPVGVVFSPTGTSYNYRAQTGRIEQASHFLYLDGAVDVKGDLSHWNSDTARYQMERDELHGEGNVETTTRSESTGDVIVVKAQSVDAQPKLQKSHYIGNVDGKITRKRAYEPPILFSSREMFLDVPAGMANLEEDVTLIKQGVTAKSKRGEIFLENYNKKLKYYVLYDDVKVSEKVRVPGPTGMRTFTRRALSEKLEGIVAEDKIILTGYPKVYQERDVIKGNRIIIRENNEVVEVDDANTNFILR